MSKYALNTKYIPIQCGKSKNSINLITLIFSLDWLYNCVSKTDASAVRPNRGETKRVRR